MAYLDHAATTPMLPQAVDRMAELLGAVGNASSLHAAGRNARRIVEESRETVAAALGARPSEVVFTSGGTESDNLAVKGIFWARHDQNDARRRVLVSAVEHHAVLDPAVWLAEQEGAELDLVGVDPAGRLTPDALRAAIERFAVGRTLVVVSHRPEWFRLADREVALRDGRVEQAEHPVLERLAFAS